MVRRRVLVFAVTALSAASATVASASGAGATSAGPGEARLVSVGSHLPPLEKLKADIARYEAAAPFDGATFYIGASSDVFRPQTFTEAQKDEMRREAKIYRSIAFAKWKYNFLSVLVDQHRLAWFDDAYWDAVTKNWIVAARLAKRLKFVGLCFDPECYGVYPVVSYWNSAWWLKNGGKSKDGHTSAPDTLHTEAQYRDVARRRGRQIGEAIFKEYPEMVLWGYYLWSFNADLIGAFSNGLLEAMPPKARLVDGDEWTGYCAKDGSVYERMKARNETGCGFLDKKLKEKHRQQGGFAPPFYLDAYAFPEKNDCLHPTINRVESPTKFFAENLKAAKRFATGGFIWIYGERYTWWPPTEREMKQGAKPISDWEADLPGLRSVLFSNRPSASRDDRR